MRTLPLFSVVIIVLPLAGWGLGMLMRPANSNQALPDLAVRRQQWADGFAQARACFNLGTRLREMKPQHVAMGSTYDDAMATFVKECEYESDDDNPFLNPNLPPR